MRIAKSVAIAGAAAVLLAACGQKGPLYLPDQGGEVVTRPGGGQTQSAPSSESTAPQPATQTPPQPKSEEQKKEQSPR